MDQQNQGGTATAPHTGDEDMTFQDFSLTSGQLSDLQRERRSSPSHGDNFLAVILVGQARWTPPQIQTALGLTASTVARACRAWNASGINGVRNISSPSYT